MKAIESEMAAVERPAMWRESRVALDAVRMLGPLLGAYLRPARAERRPLVMLVPGFGADERYFIPLRAYLRRHGFTVEGWGLGVNRAGVDLRHGQEDLSDRWEIEPKADYRGEASVPYLSERLAERVRTRHKETGRPVALVGWSLGGYLSREVARDAPDIVERVVTLGAPTIGGPKYTVAAPFFRKRGMDLDWIEREVAKREQRPIEQPVTVIYSKSDAIVNWRAALDHHSPNAKHVEVDVPHLGMGFNPKVWRHLLEALEAPAAR